MIQACLMKPVIPWKNPNKCESSMLRFLCPLMRWRRVPLLLFDSTERSMITVGTATLTFQAVEINLSLGTQAKTI